MARFLHLADIHLGFAKYDSPERTKDFFWALQDVIERYAIQEPVDFVLIAGDLFEQRQILPATLNQAQLCLDQLQAAGIPVLAIEGNHDHRPYGTATSWLRFLAEWGSLILLEPDAAESLTPWSATEKRGGYIDLSCGVRVIGSRWYGAAAPQAIQALSKAIAQLPPGPAHTVMMFHHGLEGQIARYSGALRYQDFLPLKEAGVDYLALGHIHRNYSVDNWIFNPGSLEANSITENQAQNPRGVYQVTLSDQGILAELKQDYQQRPIVRLNLALTPQQTPDQVEQAAIAYIQSVAAQETLEGAIVELRLQGTLGFDRTDLDIRSLRGALQQISEALIFLLRYDATGQLFQAPIADHDHLPSRQEIERTVFTDFLAANVNYRHQAEPLVQGLMDLKQRTLAQHGDVDLYGFTESLLREVANQDTAPDKSD